MKGRLALVDRERIVREFIELAGISSVSGQERELADLLSGRLREIGLAVEEDAAGQRAGTGTGNLIARLRGKDSRIPPLLLSAHMDTVEPGRGVSPVVSNGTISSRGDTVLGADDKAGIVAILETLRVLREHKVRHGGITVVFTVMEEQGLFGAKNLDDGSIQAGFAYVLDSDGPPGTIIMRAPSHDRIKAAVKGRAAHAGINPQDGINAIKVAAEAISAMRLGRLDHETTANIGVISGGKAINIVPDSAFLEGEARSLEPAKLKAQVEDMVATLRAAVERNGAHLDVQVEHLYSAFALAEDSPAVCLAVTAARCLGLKPVLKATGGGSDASIFNARGIHTVNLGIGMEQVHTVEERITVENLVLNARYLVEIVRCAVEEYTGEKQPTIDGGEGR